MIKRYRSWDRGEHRREWAALTLLAGLASGLAPAPVRAALDADPPEIVMSWLPGRPLSAPISPAETDALAAALGALWRPVAKARLVPPFAPVPNAAVLAGRVRSMAATVHPPDDDPLVRQAWSAAAAWLAGSAMERHAAREAGTVLGQGDSNLANFLWDGRQVRIVDFEDSGPSDRAFELAVLVEHLSARPGTGTGTTLDAGDFTGRFSLTGPEKAALAEYRRLAALFWLVMLLPGGPASDRNPAGTLHQQACRLLALLG